MKLLASLLCTCASNGPSLHVQQRLFAMLTHMWLRAELEQKTGMPKRRRQAKKLRHMLRFDYFRVIVLPFTDRERGPGSRPLVLPFFTGEHGD